MAVPFLDTNVLLRHLLGDDPVQSPAATHVLERVEKGELRVRTSDFVIMECVFTLQRTYRQSRVAIQEALLPLIEMPGVILPGKRHYRRVYELYTGLTLPFADAYHAVLMHRLRLSEIISFDADFDRVDGIRRLAPQRE